MKIFIIFIMSATFLFAQNSEPSQHQFMWKGTATALSGSLLDFQINNYSMGWHWGFEDAKLDDTMYINFPPMFPSSTWEYSHRRHIPQLHSEHIEGSRFLLFFADRDGLNHFCNFCRDRSETCLNKTIYY